MRVEGVVDGNVGVNFLTVVIVIGEGIINGGEREMWVITEEVLRRKPMVQHVHHNRANSDASAFDARTAATHLRLAVNMRMGYARHDYKCNGTTRLRKNIP